MKFTAGKFVAEVFWDSGVIDLGRLHPNGSGEMLERISINPRDLPDFEHVLMRAKKEKEENGR